MQLLASVTIDTDATVVDAINAIDSTAERIALVVDERGSLSGTITDGDVRRAILAGADTEHSVAAILSLRPEGYKTPTTISANSSQEARKQLMLDRQIRHLPVVDDDELLVDLSLLSDFIDVKPASHSAVVFAGGFGKRLSPLTDDTPKPMLPIGGRPVLNWVIDQLKAANIQDVVISTHFRPERISGHFGNGEKYGINISYAHESEPLGTAGGLRLIERPSLPILVINGDILTDLNFGDMIRFHQEHEGELTVAVRKYQTHVEYGVVESDGTKVVDLIEKPTLDFFINAGIYVLEPSCFDHFPTGDRFDMTDLIRNLIDANRNVVSFPIHESWLDIGQSSDYEQAVKENGTHGAND